MAYYPLRKANNEGTLLRPQHTFCSEEYAENMCDLFLKECVMEDGQGTFTSIIGFMQIIRTIMKWRWHMTSSARSVVSVCSSRWGELMTVMSSDCTYVRYVRKRKEGANEQLYRKTALHRFAGV